MRKGAGGEPVFAAGGNVSLPSHGNQYGGSLKTNNRTTISLLTRGHSLRLLSQHTVEILAKATPTTALFNTATSRKGTRRRAKDEEEMMETVA